MNIYWIDWLLSPEAENPIQLGILFVLGWTIFQNTKARRMEHFNSWKEGYLNSIIELYGGAKIDREDEIPFFLFLLRADLDCALYLNDKNVDGWTRKHIGSVMELTWGDLSEHAHIRDYCREKGAQKGRCENFKKFFGERNPEILKKLFGEEATK